ITAHRLRQSRSLKEPLKSLAHRLSSRVLHHPQLQHVSTVLIAHCQRLASFSVTAPPPFKIHCPNLNGRTCSAPAALTTRLSTITTAPLLSQSRSLQHSLESTFARHSPMPTQIQFPDLARSPTHMRQL